jgi:uncharacterized membrane protein
MNVLRSVALWVLSFVFTSAIDALWHLVLFKRSYSDGLKPMARQKDGKIILKGGPGLLAQALVITCLILLVVLAAKGSFLLSAAVGSLAGILAISVYGITNYALLKDWSLTMTVLEVIWGPILGGLSGSFIFWARTWLSIGPH